MSQVIDVIVTSICRPQFMKTYESFINNIQYSGIFRFIVHIDVLEQHTKHMKKLLHFLDRKGIKQSYVNHNPRGFANAINYLYEHITSPLYFHLEDDWIFLEKIDLDGIVRLFDKNDVNQVRFSKHALIRQTPALIRKFQQRNESYLALGKQMYFDNTHLIQSQIWSFNPHLAKSTIPKELSPVPEGVEPENFMCKQYWARYGTHGLYIYGRYGDGPHIKDIGRPHPLIRKINTLAMIIRHPRLIRKQERLKMTNRYRGRSWNG